MGLLHEPVTGSGISRPPRIEFSGNVVVRAARTELALREAFEEDACWGPRVPIPRSPAT